MIIDFSVKNFLSFKDAQKISFVASNHIKKLPGNVIDPKLPGELSNLRLLKALALYGPNAAGKSNVLNALSFFKSLVTDSATKTTEGDEIPVEPFALDSACENEPSEFMLRFIVGGIRYHYALALNKKRVLFESLSAFPLGREQVWFAREWDEEAGKYTWGPERPTGYVRNTEREKLTRSNALYLSKAAELNDELLAPVFLFFKKDFHFIDQSSVIGGAGPGFTGRTMIKDEKKKSQIHQMMRHADLGLSNSQVREVEYKREELPPDTPKDILDEIIGKKHISVKLGHKGHDGREFFTIDWDNESDGTIKYFSLVGPWLDIMENGYCVGIDEIETSLHPFMVMELLKLFFNKESNSSAQLLFTAHNPLLLDQTLFRSDQTWFADKDDEGATHIYPLSDFKIREDESLLKGYMVGRYGAVPFIPNGLLGKDADAK
jgi:uncharacterized protein